MVGVQFLKVGSYAENLAKPQNCQNWWMGICMGQYGIISVGMATRTWAVEHAAVFLLYEVN